MSSYICSLLILLSALVHISPMLAAEAHGRIKRAPTGLETKLSSLNAGNGMQDKSVNNPEKIKSKKKEHFKIAESPECSEDVNRFCAEKATSNNFLVLDCLQDDEKTANKLSEDCHHLLWTFKLNLTKDSRFEDASVETCAQDIGEFPDCKKLEQGQGEIIPCLIEHYDNIKTKPCRVFLNKMAAIIFSDFRLMNFFIKDCIDDIKEHHCGRLENDDDSPHNQGKTVACLNKLRRQLSKACKKALNRVAELQADDFHLDRPLYYACKGDREYLCHDFTAGEGAVFKCLYSHLGDARLSDNCREKLEERQQLIAEDVKADKAFFDVCEADITQNKCIKEEQGGDSDADFSRSAILLCLEKAHSLNNNVKPECLQAVFELRSELMQDYKISPELASTCKNEITHFCLPKRGDDVLQCLMKEITKRSKNGDDDSSFSPECKTEVTNLVRIVNPGEDIRLDRPLLRVCGDVIAQACSEHHAGQGDKITCLLENLDHDDMTDACEDELLVIQYFAARDFRLDAHLFQRCKADAKKLCHSDGFSDPRSMEPDQGPVIFSCLHRYLRSDNPKDEKPSDKCIHEIRRVMRERSTKINLLPEIEAVCLGDLSSHCSDNDEHKEVNGEINCLQSVFDDLTPKCKAAVGNFTREEFEDPEIDRTLLRACKPMMLLFCKDLLNSDAIPNDVYDCLIENKNHNDMDEKCSASIEHHQIISLKDYRFSVKFREFCQNAVNAFCNNLKTKYEIVACLSKIVRDDTLKENEQRIDDRCKRQIKFELLQRSETVVLDPALQKNCLSDIEQFCHNRKNGDGQVLECLRAHKKKLTSSCQQIVFQRQKDDAMFGDYTLLHVCKKMIKSYCPIDAGEADILDCLKKNLDKGDFDDGCRQVVLRRQVEQAQDIQLDPHLQKACRLDIPKFCGSLFKEVADKDKGLEGKIIDCLKKKYASKAKILSRDCEHEIQSRIKEAALDVNLNPSLIKHCKEDIQQLCQEKIAGMEDDGSYKAFGIGAIMECLKKRVKELKNKECKEEVVSAIVESSVDVHVDPLLNSVCQKDLEIHCKSIPQGQGRQMSCLLAYLESDPKSLMRNCKEMLQRRKDLWEYAAMVAPAESLSEIFDQMSSSPARNYFFAILFTVVGIIFLVGLTCGRVTKKVRAEIKNK